MMMMMRRVRKRRGGGAGGGGEQGCSGRGLGPVVLTLVPTGGRVCGRVYSSSLHVGSGNVVVAPSPWRRSDKQPRCCQLLLAEDRLGSEFRSGVCVCEWLRADPAGAQQNQQNQQAQRLQNQQKQL